MKKMILILSALSILGACAYTTAPLRDEKHKLVTVRDSNGNAYVTPASQAQLINY